MYSVGMSIFADKLQTKLGTFIHKAKIVHNCKSFYITCCYNLGNVKWSSELIMWVISNECL